MRKNIFVFVIIAQSVLIILLVKCVVERGYTIDDRVNDDLVYLKSIDQIRQLPIVFIGGHYRSGTTLMRALLDVHPSLSCGPETFILPEVVNFLGKYLSKQRSKWVLNEAGISMDTTIFPASSLFIYHTIKYRKTLIEKYRQNKRLCVKDPELLSQIDLLKKIFPNAKFIHMYRDGRASAYSYMMHRLKPSVVTFNKFLEYFNRWNQFVESVDLECSKPGSNCIQVKYEDLVSDTKSSMKRVADFLNIEWTDRFLNHEQYINKEIVVSKIEWSSDQIKNKIYNTSLSPDLWLSKIPNYDSRQVNTTMLKRFGYDLTLGS